MPENSPSKTLVGSLSSVDVNPKDNHTYAVVPGRSYAGKFELIGNELYTLVTFDYETGPKRYDLLAFFLVHVAVKFPAVYAWVNMY